MAESTRQQRDSGGPVEAGLAHWRESYERLGAYELDELRASVAVELASRGLAPATARDYSALVLQAERFCRERGTTVLTASPEVLGRFAATLTLNKRAQGASALRHFFGVLGRPEPLVPALRVAGRQPGRSRARTEGHCRGAPHAGHGWERTESAGAARVRQARDRMLRDSMSETTIRHYSSMLWRAERWCEERDLALAELDARTLAEYAETLSGPSRRVFRSALRPYYAALDVDDPPIGAVRAPRKSRLVARPLELDEARRLLVAAVDEGGPRGVAVLLGLLLGLRRFEIAKLRFADFSLGWVRFVGKGQLEAALPVPELVMSGVAHLPHDSPFLFPGQSGGSANPATVWGWVRSLARDAGVVDVSTHRLRHTCLTIANDATGDLRAVQDFARHADPDTTAGYTRVTRDRLSSISLAVLDALSGPEIPPAEPLVPLSLMVQACDGASAVAPWLALARILGGRPGWRLDAVDDGSATMFYAYGDNLSADVMAYTNGRPPVFSLTRVLDPTEEHAAWWNFADVASLEAVLAVFETGELVPFTPTAYSHSELAGGVASE